MSYDKKEYREWYLNPACGYKCEVNEGGIGLSGNEVHVVEYAALEAEKQKAQKLVEALKGVIRFHIAPFEDSEASYAAEELLEEYEADNE